MMEQTLRLNQTLEELAVQGHGLNGKVGAQYQGYTQGFQHRVDNKTLYVGSGLDHNQKAIADFFDDVVISHAPFPTVLHNGHLIQLNQNGNREETLSDVVIAANAVLFTMSLTPADFSKTPA